MSAPSPARCGLKPAPSPSALPKLQLLVVALLKSLGAMGSHFDSKRMRKKKCSPFFVEVCGGDAPIETPRQDLRDWTKLNYNLYPLADRTPMALKFAEQLAKC